MSSVTLEKYLFAQKGSKEGMKKSILETLLLVHGRTVADCPVAEDNGGQLRNSYMISYDNKEQGFNSQSGEQAPAWQKLTVRSSEMVGYVGTNSDHWYPEFGTRNQVAQPHLRPAIMIAKGSSAKAVMATYCREKMLSEFKQRRFEYIFKEIK